MSDLLLGLGHGSEMFLDDIIKIIDLTMTAVYDFKDCPHEKEYSDDLKKVII